MKIGLFSDPHCCSANDVGLNRRPALSYGKIKAAMEKFKKEVEIIINALNIDNYFDIPDYILADYLANQLEVLDVLKTKKDKFFGKKITISGIEEVKGD